MCALREPLGDIGRIEMYVLLFIIINVIKVLLLLLLALLLLLLLLLSLSRFLYCAQLSKKKKGKKSH